ncbi:hypothetical protein MKP08_09855 [Erythrobacter sp. LQ02-29]|uniref:hypothetical protein n=1 Tax=Erythrobacter sp. LQ02-29 TaxID=2920384 RepID=UPI001F4EF267|nr:hypothetical protein [Erythrobacter sp. LQ02-29]MCP9223051.1 hypothetical protein [Erythrobacter sp. LQ02-29]
MKHDPTYLSSQSRALHRTYRRNRRFLNVAVVVWSAAFAALALAATIDWVASIGWGFSPRDVWAFLGFAVGGGIFWVFATLIAKINLRFIRLTYGPDPSERSDMRR